MKEKLIKAFYQGKDKEMLGAGNCASVAIIKAAMFTFQYDVFKHQLNGDVYSVILKNGEKISFSKDEYAYATEESSFIPGRAENKIEQKTFMEILKYANLCFTVICKMAQKHGDYSSRFSKFITPDNFKLAVEIINDGTLTPEVFELLGLEEYVSPTYRINLLKRIKSKNATVIWTKSHAMFAAEGYFDRYGKSIKLKSRFMKKYPGKMLTGIFILKSS